MKQEFPLLI